MNKIQFRNPPTRTIRFSEKIEHKTKTPEVASSILTEGNIFVSGFCASTFEFSLVGENLESTQSEITRVFDNLNSSLLLHLLLYISFLLTVLFDESEQPMGATSALWKLQWLRNSPRFS